MKTPSWAFMVASVLERPYKIQFHFLFPQFSRFFAQNLSSGGESSIDKNHYHYISDCGRLVVHGCAEVSLSFPGAYTSKTCRLSVYV
jgi:hypothetical protein